LYDELLSPKRYNKLIRPRASGDGPTIVYLGLRPSQFIDVDEQKEVMRTLVWLEQEWQEPLLSWDPQKYENIQSIHIPAEELWRPDIVLYNNVNGKYEITTMTRAEVFSNGTVRWMPPALYLSACRIDMEYFPHDEQTCSMRFGSWTYDGSKVELRHHLQKFAPELHRPIYIDYAADLHDFESTVEYDITSLSAICANNFYQHSIHPYPEITFRLRMRRRYTFYAFNFLFPCVGVAILAVMTFILPPDCREKISLTINALLALTLFFLLLISGTAPATSLAVPLMGKYLLFTIVLITSSIFWTVVVLNVHFRSVETHSTPNWWLRRIFLEIIPPFLGLRPPNQSGGNPCKMKSSNDQLELDTIKNEWAVDRNGLTKCKSKGFPSRTQETEYNPLACQITRQLIEQCSDETQLRMRYKLHQVAEGSQFIEHQLKSIERECNVALGNMVYLRFLVAILMCGLQGTFSYKEASRLYDVLINQQGYNKILRPVANANDTLTVFFGLGLLQLMDLDEVNQILTTNVWVELEWTDSKLVWEPKDFGGVTALFIPSELLWLPDLLLYNNADGNYVIDIMTKAIVYYNGTIRWTPPAIFKSSCPINVQYFPYDIQECFMKFGSWTYNGNQVSLKHITQKRIPEHEGNVHIDHAVNLKDFYPSVEFELLEVSAIRRAEYYTCCADPFIDVTFKLALRRKTLFYTINLIIPCVGIAFLTILVFYLPSQSGGKIALSINVLLGLTVFLLLLAESIPPTGLAMPLIGKYLLFTMGLVSLSILKTIFVLNLHHRTPNKPAPNFGNGRIGRKLLKLIGLEPPSKSTAKEDKSQLWPMSLGKKGEIDRSMDASSAEQRLLKFIHNLRTLAEHFSKYEERKRYEEDWLRLAMISDRICLCFFMAACLTGKTMGDLQITHWDEKKDGVFSSNKMKAMLEKEGFTVIPYTFSPGTDFPNHTHNVDKKDAITAGKFSFTMHGKTVVLSAGDTIFVPKNTVHAAHVVGDEDPIDFDYLEFSMGEFVVDHWNEATDGILNRENMKKKLEKQGYSAYPYTFNAGMTFGTHTHDVDKKDVVVDGRLEFHMYGKSIILEPGDTLEVPKGVPHSAKVIGTKNLEFFDATKL
uniref:Neur_chan_LBD domain-containing protein n=1 Tax=Rodentolepis nana TaxID=102285 RepID=A0A158QII8_RODNA